MNSLISYAASTGNPQMNASTTVGIVVDTNDPQGDNRLRVCCPRLGDNPDPKSMRLEDIPWATVSSTFGGIVTQGYRGISSKVTGDAAYGIYGPIKRGAEVLVTTVDNNPAYRVVIGCLTPRLMMNTYPHGRFAFTADGYPSGPTAVNGEAIEPITTNLTQQFTGVYAPVQSYEWLSRACDYSYTAYDELRSTRQSVSDVRNVTLTEADGNTKQISNGYAPSRSGPLPEVSPATDVQEPHITAIVSPGLHAISMDDKAENCRVRIRTTTGHQLIMDDTNERIYLSTNTGKNWVEMDSNGNIDIHSDSRVSIHAAKDINLTSQESIRMSAKNIHMRSSNETRLFSNGAIHINTNNVFRVESQMDTLLESHAEMHLKSANALRLHANGISMLSDAGILSSASNTISLKAGSDVVMTGSRVVSNDPSTVAPVATPATSAEAKTAYHSNRIPNHEPWPRVMVDRAVSDNDESVDPVPVDFTSGSMADMELKSYDDPKIGRIENGVPIQRNPRWHR